jgi:hypothetical protein
MDPVNQCAIVVDDHVLGSVGCVGFITLSTEITHILKMNEM